MARARPGEPYPKGTRVHHRGAIHSRRQPDHRHGGLAGGWGEVLRSVKQGDGTYEYEVRADRGIAGERRSTSGRETWWGSHHIDESLPAEKRKCPDDGTCHHGCGAGECFRVHHCAPLTEYGEDWKPEHVEAFVDGGSV